MRTNRKLFFIATIAVLLIAAACSGVYVDPDAANPGDSNPFVGTWSGDGLSVTCTNNTWTATDGYSTWSGTYSPNGNSATFTQTNGAIFGTATVSGDTMTVVSSEGTFHLTKSGSGDTTPGGTTPSIPASLPGNYYSLANSNFYWALRANGTCTYHGYSSTRDSTYTVSGSTLRLDGSNWTIVDSTTIRDPDGNRWTKR